MREPFFAPADVLARGVSLATVWTADVYGRNLPWHAIERAKLGAFATLAGIEIALAPPHAWRAVALGDSAIIVLRDGRLAGSLPFARSEEFPERPLLLASIAERNGDLAAGIRTAEGTARSGDRIVLATDALARALFTALEHDPSSSGELLRSLAAPDGGAAGVARYRASGALQNDDVAAIVVGVP